MYNKNTHSSMSVSFFIVFYCILLFPQLHPFSSQILVVAIVLDMPVVVHGAVAVCYTIAAGHMNFALIIAHSKHLLYCQFCLFTI